MNHGSHSHEQGVAATKQVAVAATLHCLTGCAIGEILGLTIGTILELPTVVTIVLSIALAFVFGYALSLAPLIQQGIEFKKAAKIVLAADTLSILTMEIVDNTVMTVIPGAMSASLVNPLFWIMLPISLFAGFLVALPVNYQLLKRGKGHALVHESLHG